MDPLFLAGAVLAALAAVGLGAAAWTLLQEGRASDRLGRLVGGDTEDDGDRRVGDADLSFGVDAGDEEARRPAAASLDDLAVAASRLAVSDDEQLAALRRQLLQAGFREKNAAERYSAARALGALGAGLLGVLVLPKTPLVVLAGGALVLTALGYYAPALYVEARLDARRRALLRAFPDALDLLVSCVEAGLGVDAALRRVAEELATAAPDLARELQLVTHEVNAGVPRGEALRHLHDRTGIDDIGSLVNVLVQAERFGTSVGRALRTHAEHVRVRRMQRAEEAAARVSPKLTVLLILFVLPCLIVLLVGPAVMNVTRILVPATTTPAAP